MADDTTIATLLKIWDELPTLAVSTGQPLNRN
jgi:hypothetical protein